VTRPGTIAAFLLENGWTRSDATPEELGFCDAITLKGSCEKAPRWFRPFDGSLCAIHAEQATRSQAPLRRP
jgi:hypothetical protein